MEISGYIGDTVTLALGAGSLLNLVKVEWSVFANTTLIATYEKGKTKVDWFYQYAGRLCLNITTGKRSFGIKLFCNFSLYTTSSEFSLSIRRLDDP